MRVSAQRARNRIAVVWFLMSGLAFLFVLLLCLTVLSHLRGALLNAFLPSVVPTATLIAGALAQGELSGTTQHRSVDRNIYRLALGTSIFYFFILYVLLVVQGWQGLGADPAIEELGTLQSFQIVVTALQGIVSALLGAFFVEQRKENEIQSS